MAPNCIGTGTRCFSYQSRLLRLRVATGFVEVPPVRSIEHRNPDLSRSKIRGSENGAVSGSRSQRLATTTSDRARPRIRETTRIRARRRIRYDPLESNSQTAVPGDQGF